MKDSLDQLHESVANQLLARVNSGEATSAELSVAVKFLKDNNAILDIITTDSPLANLLEDLPFEEAHH